MINCFARCVAACAEESDSEELKQCESNCHKYSQEELCRDHNHHHHVIPECWPKCRDLGYPSQDDLHVLKHQMTSPKNFSASYNSDFKIDAKWEAIKDAIYFVEIESDNVGYDLHLVYKGTFRSK
jgi:hypothetical protein